MFPPLEDVIASVESSGRSGAIRFEPGVYERLTGGPVPPCLSIVQRANGPACSVGTAQMIYSTSWGRFQLMGFTLYGAPISYAKPIAAYLASDNDQSDSFWAFLRSKGLGGATTESLANDQNARIAFATKYNGPGAPVLYAQKIADAIKALSK